MLSKQDACEAFINEYLQRGFGVMPKKEVDRLVYSLLVESGRIDDPDDYFAVSRLIKVTPTKAANLAYEYCLIHKPKSTLSDLKTKFGQLLANTNLGRVHGRAALEVRERMLREDIEHHILDMKLAAPDYSFNRNLLLLDYETLAALVIEFAGPETMKRLDSALKKTKGLPQGLPSGKELFSLFLERAAGEAGERTAEKVINIAEIVLTGGTTTMISAIKKYFSV